MNILFVSSGFQLFDKLDCGASIRSTMFLEAMCHIGSVDVISFYKNEVKSNIDNCQVVGCYPIEKKIEELTFSKKMSDLYRLLTNPLSPYTYYLKNESLQSKNETLVVQLKDMQDKLDTALDQVDKFNKSLEIIQENIKKNTEAQEKFTDQMKKIDNVNKNASSEKLDDAIKKNSVIDLETSHEYKKLFKEIFSD